jgi:hypothetical protein
MKKPRKYVEMRPGKKRKNRKTKFHESQRKRANSGKGEKVLEYPNTQVRREAKSNNLICGAGMQKRRKWSK